jgi:hypothetical protein
MGRYRVRGQGSGVTLSLSDLIRYNDARLIDVESQTSPGLIPLLVDEQDRMPVVRDLYVLS